MFVNGSHFLPAVKGTLYVKTKVKGDLEAMGTPCRAPGRVIWEEGFVQSGASL